MVKINLLSFVVDLTSNQRSINAFARECFWMMCVRLLDTLSSEKRLYLFIRDTANRIQCNSYINVLQ